MKFLKKKLYWFSREARMIRYYNSGADTRYVCAALLKSGELASIVSPPQSPGDDWLVKIVDSRSDDLVCVKTHQIREISPERHFYGYE